MTLETFLVIYGAIWLVILGIAYRYFSKNVYIRPKKYRIERYMK